jgi:hypothetical protein
VNLTALSTLRAEQADIFNTDPPPAAYWRNTNQRKAWETKGDKATDGGQIADLEEQRADE